ncbi:MAG: DUF167 domain-containing protein [Nanoarchaeota archaeon]|nr:DUF167 domain-containing protein [Nanoarchaeota archaeon]
MIVEVKVVPKSSKISVEKKNGKLHVKLTAPPEKGKANKQLVEVLAEHFGVSKSKVKILKGETSHNKVVEIRLDASVA